MSTKFDQEKLEEFAKHFAPQLKSESDLNDFSRALLKMTVEKALEGELEHHLGYSKHDPEGNGSGNSRNGKSSKRLKGDHGEVEIEVPRDRNGTFEPALVKKNQSRLTGMDDQILALYAKGMTTRDIASAFKEMYDVDVCHTLISQVTDAVKEQVTVWQNRPLDRVYPIMYLDCIVVKVHEDKRVINKSVYVALGVNMEGNKELLGLWISETEGAKFWLSVLTELKNRGVEDVFIMCTDGLKGFPDAIEAVFPKAITQTCIVHLIRNSLKYVPHKDKKRVAADLKTIYTAATVEEAELALEMVDEAWGGKYAAVIKAWRSAWDRLIPFLSFPPEIRKVVYTTNAIESVNSVFRKVINQRKIFPNDTSVMKTLYLVIKSASLKWTMPIRDWPMALNLFTIAYEDRV